jgi:signal transduction histidine kinase/HAMP domain-containing protein
MADTGLTERRGLRLAFRSRLMVALIGASTIPLVAFGVAVIVLIGLFGGAEDTNLGRLLIFGLAVMVLIAVVSAVLLAAELTRPLRAISASVGRISAGDVTARMDVPGDDELARLADSHDRLAADLNRRTIQVGRMLDAMGRMSPRDGPDPLAARAGDDARWAFDLIDATVVLGPPSAVPEEEVVPGETRPLRAVMRIGDDEVGVLLGRLPATRAWARADQDLFELFASQIAVAVRSAQLFAQVEEQNTRLIELDAAKDDFLRGVSHNLQTPLTSIRAYSEQLAEARPDRRLDIITEQSERLSRMVRQLLTVTRLESGALKPRNEVVSLGARTRKAWEALGANDVPFELEDTADSWLAIADPDQLDQVLWALLDNAVKYGGGSPVTVTIEPEPERSELRLSIADGGQGVAEEDRARLFDRFQRGSTTTPSEGSGLGLWVSRELCRAMGGDLRLEPPAPGRGATFTIRLPAEAADET